MRQLRDSDPPMHGWISAPERKQLATYWLPTLCQELLGAFPFPTL